MRRPLDTPLTSIGEDQKPGKQPASGNISRPTDPRRIPPNSYVTADRLYQIAQDMDDRDWRLLSFVRDVRLATGSQLVRHLWQTEPTGAAGRSGRRTLARLRSWRVLDAGSRRVGGMRAGSDGFVHSVGVAGMKLLTQRGIAARRLDAPGALFQAHTLAITETIVRLHEADRSGELDLVEVQPEPACWRGFIGKAMAREMLKPDLFLRLGAGAFEYRFFIEIDLATESRGTLRTKADRYRAYYQSGEEQRQHGAYPKVLWVVPDDRRADQLHDALGRPDARLFDICRQSDLIAYLAAEAQR